MIDPAADGIRAAQNDVTAARLKKTKRPTPAQLKALAHCAAHGPIIEGALAPAKGINALSVSAAEKYGWLARTDGPFSLVDLTDAGRLALSDERSR